jgi:hypothetical protein
VDCAEVGIGTQLDDGVIAESHRPAQAFHPTLRFFLASRGGDARPRGLSQSCDQGMIPREETRL